MRSNLPITQTEYPITDETLIVSKTDLKGKLTAGLGDQVLRDGFGDFFVDYYLKLKQAEIDRFNSEVSDWEQREYFDLL